MSSVLNDSESIVIYLHLALYKREKPASHPVW